jgi:putative Holliday junction resolvase
VPAVATVPSRAGTVLAFDFGTKRIGVAVGESLLGLAHPLTTIAEEQTERRFAAIEALVREWQPVQLVVGLPVHADGAEHAMTANARRFARRLEGRFALPVALVDERYSTDAAAEAMRSAGARERDRHAVRDQLAAQIILQAYFDQQRES